MTQPRKAQIKSVNTKYTAGDFVMAPGDGEAVISESALNGFAVTDVPGGAEEDVQAVVRGTALGPFPILAGDSVTFNVDGGPPVLVTFAGTDTTASRAAARINSALSANVASNAEGRLLVQSLTFGAASSLKLTDSTPGTLAKFGILPGTYAGLAGPSRGVLTRTRDLLGGVAEIATVDGRHLVTDSYDSRITGLSGGSRVLSSSIPGGVPVHGRLTFDGTDYRLRYFARFPSKASVVTFNSSFSSINGSDSLDLTVDGLFFTVTFPAFPYTRDQLIARINAVYAAALGLPDGHAVADGTVGSPYDLTSDDVFSLSVDGAPDVSVAFTGGEVTASQVAARINTVVGSSVASAVGSRVRLSSPTSGGFGSSLRLTELSASGSAGALRKLGIRPGFYRGAFVAEPYGPDEIRISGQVRGSSGSLTVGGLSGTLTRLGLVAGTTLGTDEPREEPVPAPAQNTRVPAPFPVDMIFPEVMEFGDIDPKADPRVQEFLARSAGSNQALSMLNPSFVAAPESGYDGQSRGLYDVGKPVTVGPDGSIPRGYLQGAFDYSDSLFKQFLRYPGGTVVAIVGSRFETPGFGGNPLSPASPMNFVADPTGTLAGSVPGFRFYTGDGSGNSDLSVRKDATAFGASVPAYVRVGNGNVLYSDVLSGGSLNQHGLKLADLWTTNISDFFGGGNGDKYIPLSADVYDGTLKVGGVPTKFISGDPVFGGPSMQALAAVNSLVRAANKFEITVGDGFYSHGDFIGGDALKQARDFLAEMNAATGGLAQCAVIKVRPGIYDVADPGLDFSFLQELVIEGYSPQGDETFSEPLGANSAIQAPGLINIPVILGAKFHTTVRNISFYWTNVGAYGPTWISTESPSQSQTVTIEDCTFYAGDVILSDARNVFVRRCNFRGDLDSTAIQRSVLLLKNTTFLAPFGAEVPGIVTWLAEDCYFCTRSDSAAVSLIEQRADSSVGVTYMGNLEFSRCVFMLSAVTVTLPGGPSSSLPVGNASAGMLVLEPGSNPSSGNGLKIRNVKIDRCEVLAGYFPGIGSGNASPALNLAPSGWFGSQTWTLGLDPMIILDSVSVTNCVFEDWNANGLNECPLVMVGGVGVVTAMDPYYMTGRLEFKNNFVQLYGRPAGRPMACHMPWLTKPDYPGLDNLRLGGAVCLSGWDIDLHGLKFDGTVSLSRSPELFLCPYLHMQVNDVVIRPVPGGSSLIPWSRVYIRNPYNPKWEISNLHIVNEVDTTQWCADGVVYIEPGHNFGFPFYISTAEPNAEIRKVIRDFYILLAGASDGGAAFAGISFPSIVGFFIPYTTACSPASVQGLKNGGLLIENGYIGSGNFAGGGFRHGLAGAINGIGAVGQEIDHVHIRGVTIDSCARNGIRIYAGHFWYPIVVEDCVIFNCGLFQGFGGITLFSYDHNEVGTPKGSFQVNRNQVSYCNTGITQTQITCRDVNSTNNPLTRALIYGNNCFGNDGTTNSGAINVNRTASLIISTGAAAMSLTNLRGVETSYGTGTVSYSPNTGAIMYHNLATLRSSNAFVAGGDSDSSISGF